MYYSGQYQLHSVATMELWREIDTVKLMIVNHHC